jgi:hypothetical protein
MIHRAFEQGVGTEYLAHAFNFNLISISRLFNFLDGIVYKAIALMQDHQFTPNTGMQIATMAQTF